MSTLLTGKTDRKLFIGLIITLGISMLFPEYIAPFFVFALYIHFMVVFKKSNRNAKLGELGKVFFFYTIYMLITSIWSKTHFFSGEIAMLWMGMMLGYIEVANIITTEDKLKNAITAVNLSAGLIGLIAILEFATHNLTARVDWFHIIVPNPLYYDINNLIFKLLPVEVTNYKFASRASATFDNPLILATYLVMTTPFCAFGSVYFKRSKNRKISRICLLLAVGGILGTSSRSSYLAIASAMIILIFSSKKLMKKLWPFIIALAIGIPSGLLVRYKNDSASDFFNSDNKRIEIWKSCVKMFEQKPIFGHGAGTENVHQALINTYNIDRTHAHNLFLEQLVEGGIVGIIFVVIIIYIIAKNLFKIISAKNGKYRYYGAVYTSSLVAFIIMSLTEHTLQSPKELMIFFFILGFVEATYRIVMNKTQCADDEIVYEEVIDEITEQIAEEVK